MVNQYIKEKRSLDSGFVTEAIRLFGEKFPKSLEDYGIQFNHLTMYSDEERIAERNQIKQDLYEHFAVTWLNFSTPIQGKESMSFLKDSGGTQFIIVDRNREEVFSILKNMLPELSGIAFNVNEDFVISYYDQSKRLIVAANIQEGKTRVLFKAIRERKFVDTANLYWKL